MQLATSRLKSQHCPSPGITIRKAKSIDTVSLYNRIRSLEKSDEFLHHKKGMNANENQEKNKIDPKHNDFAIWGNNIS